MASCYLSCVSPSAWAEEEEAPDFAGATMSGNWGGLREAGWHSGWLWDATLKVDALQHRGGQSSGVRAMRAINTMSNLDLRLKADLSKVANWDGATAYVHVLDNRGAGLNARRVGSLMGVSNIEVPTPTTRIFHAWLQQNFLEDQVSLLGGLYPIDSEFFVMDSAAVLLHPAYGTPADLALTHGASIFNNSAFGLRLKWQSAKRTHYVQGALLDGIPNDPAHPKRTTIRLAKGDGVFAIAEFGWTPIEYGHVFEPTTPTATLRTPGLVTHEKYEGTSKYALGFWRYGNRVSDRFDPESSDNPLVHRTQGGYLLAERTLLNIGAGAGRDLTAFARYTLSDGYATEIDRSWNLGLRLRGPLASRPDDILALGWSSGRLSPQFRAAQAANGIETAVAEDALEITWRAAISKWLALQPNLQIVRHPGGDSASKTSTVLGLRFELAL
jgi:porin